MKGRGMDFEEIRGLARHHKQTFGRIVNSEMYRLEDGRLLAVTNLHDDYHDIRLGILLSETYRIEEIAGKMDRIPYPCCGTKPLEVLSALKGIGVLERGGMKKVRERIPRDLGCTHVYEMIESSFRAVFVGSYSILHQDWEGVLDLGFEEHRQLGIRSPVFAGSCYAFNTETADAEAFARAQEKIGEAQRRKAAIDALKKGEGNHGV
ncbi:MAG: DUF2889 domain-containing protein [Thermodesulfobacteriota bacterium]